MAIEPFLGTRAQQGFLATVIIQGVAVLAMVGITFALVDAQVDLTEGLYKTIPCYLALFAFAVVYEILVTLDALRRRNVIQLIGIGMFNVALVVFGALQVRQTHTALVDGAEVPCDGSNYASCSGPGSLFNKVEPFLIAAPCIIAASSFVLGYFIRMLFIEFGWVVFHIVGANPKMKTMYQYYQVLQVLLKFDFFIFVALTMQLLILVISRSGAEFPLTIIAIPVVLVLIGACVIAVQREIKWLMTVSLILMVGAQAYFLYKFTRLFTKASEYTSTRGTLAVFTITAFIMLFATFAVGLRCFADFDKDLVRAKTTESRVDAKRRRPEYKDEERPMSQERSSYVGGTELAPRMSIE